MSGRTVGNRSPFRRIDTNQFNKILKEVRKEATKKKAEQAKRDWNAINGRFKESTEKENEI